MRLQPHPDFSRQPKAYAAALGRARAANGAIIARNEAAWIEAIRGLLARGSTALADEMAADFLHGAPDPKTLGRRRALLMSLLPREPRP
jgi:proline dehydrogenase